MKTSVCLAMLLACVTGCGEKSKPGDPATNTSSSSPLTAPVDYLGAVAKAKQRAEGTVETVNITKAISLFQTEFGRNPKDLNELVQEKFLPRVPDAPYGMQIVYDPKTAQVTIVKKPE